MAEIVQMDCVGPGEYLCLVERVNEIVDTPRESNSEAGLPDPYPMSLRHHQELC